MIRTALAFLLIMAAATQAQIRHAGSMGLPPNAKDRSGLSGNLAPGVSADTLGSIGSGLAWTGKDGNFIMLAGAGPEAAASDYQTRLQFMELYLDELDGLPVGAPTVTRTVILTDDAGKPFIGGRASANRLNPAGIRVGADGVIYICDDYGPSVLSFSQEGKLLRRFDVPEKFLCTKPSADPKDELPPAATKGRLPGRGFRGLAITPKGDRLYTIAGAPLIQDGALDGSGKRAGVNVRILEIAIADGKAREFLYQMESPEHCISDLLAVNDRQLLLIERDDKAGEDAKAKKIILIDLSGASDISGLASLPPRGAPDGAKAVAAKPLFNLMDPALKLDPERMLPRVDGMAWGKDLSDGSRTLILASDNAFDPNEPHWFWVITIGKKDLPGFEAQTFTAR